MGTTVCPKCSECYEEFSEEEANSPDRSCLKCFKLIKIVGDAGFEKIRRDADRQGLSVHDRTALILYDYIIHGKKFFNE